MENKKILVAGANSYIGKSFMEYMRGFDEYTVDAISVRDNSWKDMDFGNYDVVYDVAGIAHIKETDENRHLYYEVNRDLAVALALKAKADGVKQFIYLSSMSVYGLTTGHIDKTTKVNPVNAYGKSKLEAEQQLMKLADSDFMVSIVRPPMVYGDGCKGNYQLLKQFALKVKSFPNLYNQRSMISIDSMSKGIKKIIDFPKTAYYHPQEPEYIKTYDMVKSITEGAGHNFHTINLGRGFVRFLGRHVDVFKKVFGSLTYDYWLDEPCDFKDGLVSIVMPLYNGEKFVAEAINSVRTQDYENWELLVVNDGSKDNGPDLVTLISKEDSRVKLINKDNGGVASARNVGIKAATGQYIAFLDSDDKWNDGKLTKQLNCLNLKNGKFCFTGTAFMDEDGNSLDKYWKVPEVVDYKKLLRANVIPCSSVLIDRTGLKSFLMPKLRHEDYATWLSLLRDNNIKAYGINEPLFTYRRSSNSVSSNKLATLSWTWHVYYDSQGFGWLKSTFCFIRFEALTLMKYLRK